MRALVCQACGASDFKYEHGLYECTYCGTKYVFDGNERFTVSPTGSVLTMVSVRFKRGYKTYDYIYDLPDLIKVGSYVVVNGFEGETRVRVERIRQVNVESLPMPLEAYKRVLRTGIYAEVNGIIV